MTLPIEPICSLEGPPCFAHDGTYLGRGPVSFERYLRIGMRRRTEDMRHLEIGAYGLDGDAEMFTYGTCNAIGRGSHGEEAFAWQAACERSTLHLERELVQWRLRKLNAFSPGCELEWRVMKVELKALETRERELNKLLAPAPKKKLDPKRLPG